MTSTGTSARTSRPNQPIWLRQAPLISTVALVLLVLVFFRRLAFTNLILARGDTFLYFYPYWDYRAQSFLAGHLPLWNPLLFMGAPFLANSQAGVLYPFNWPLALMPAPVAVKVALVFHVVVAALGTFLFGRRALGQSTLGALLAAALFSLGGYFTAQAEHVNQLQGLAWLPWLLLIAHALARRLTAVPRQPIRAIAPTLAAAAIIALQILAGHTQSAFISLTGALVYATVVALIPPRPQSLVPALCLLAAASLAVLLSAGQVLPTLELSGQSLRGGGLPLREALSFSLDPRLLGRALLPGYSRALFSEFVGYLGICGLGLAVAGLKRTPARLAMLALAALGLLFALGAYDPLYALLAALPPFNLFRVPARWLVLFGFGIALLAGSGLEEFMAASPRRKVAMLIVPLALIALTPLASRLVPAGETGPLDLPRAIDWAGWLIPLLILGVLVWLPGAHSPRWRATAAAALAVVELFLASSLLPYNHLTSPDAYTSVRPAMTQLLVAARAPARPATQGNSNPGAGGVVASSNLVTTVATSAALPLVPRLNTTVAGRFLSMSALRFDPGDLAELHAELDPQLPADAVYDFVVAAKNKEVQSPNLPLTWGLAAVDGYDGGVLPLRHYAAFTQLFTGAPSPDGRLRENLTSAPDPRLLSLVNAQYLITDKVGDAWVDGVFYDLQFTLTLAAGETTEIAYLPPFQATALGVVAESYSGQAALTFADGSRVALPITAGRVRLKQPATPVAIALTGPLTIRGLSLIDERSAAFQSLTLGPYRLAHSGDVKVYENLAVLPRAFVASRTVVTAGDAEARALLADPTFDPAATAILSEPASDVGAANGATITATRPATITRYAPDLVQLSADGPGVLLLTDAYYPGWTATIDGASAPILRADIMFRALSLPPGPHEIAFRYSPASVRAGLWISALTVLAMVLAVLVLLWKSPEETVTAIGVD